MKDYIIQLLENAGVSLPNENSLGQKIVPDDSDKLSNFWNWFGDSKAVDSQGRPLVFFHGNSSKRNGRDIPEFSSFDRSKLGRKSHFSSKVGFFFSSSEAMAKGFGDRIMAVYLKMDRPMQYNSGSNVDSELEEKYYNEHKKDDEYADRPLRAIQKHTDSYDKFVADIYHKNGDIPYWAVNEISFYDAYNLGGRKDEYINNYVNALKQEGYDSIVINNTVADKSVNGGYKTTQYCVFEPNQIKSIKNNGNFSGSDNIYESIEYAEMLDDGNMFEVHKNPSDKEFWDLMRNSRYKKLRALVSVDEKERVCFVWDAYYGGTHNDILGKYLAKYNQNMSHYAQVYCTGKGIEVFGFCPEWFKETYYKPIYSKDEIENISKALQDIFDDDDLGLLK